MSSEGEARTAGQLFVVCTPIGNLSDITLRALEVLRAVPHLVAEDTRHTRGLLSHFGIAGKTLHRLDAHADSSAVERIVGLLGEGQDVALVTDAGAPAVSDPGAALVSAAHAQGARVIPIPGPSAVTAAIAASGLVQGAFLFLGFLPRHGAKRKAALTRLVHTADAAILFESPQRIGATLEDLAALMPDRPAAVCRELTKLHEEIALGSLADLAQRAAWRGEITLVLGAWQAPEEQSAGPIAGKTLEHVITEHLGRGLTPHSVVRELSANSGMPRRALYALVQRLNAELKEAPLNPADGNDGSLGHKKE